MDAEKCHNIIEAMPETVIVLLDNIKRFLSEGRASVLVGSGFSKNAEMDNPSVMLDWKELGTAFYKKLHKNPPSDKDLRFQSVTRLAQQVEAFCGRNELERCILNSLPDNLIRPGDLHQKMMGLPWRDVFTTNYDTLLERTADKIERKYNVVTNKETLLYCQSPRIIKLHGSFPNIRPFIITEEDFRTYPEKYPEFVNTVRQALIENVFCLLGFSGDDPNFLSWEGWLRTVMGGNVSRVYLIDWKDKVEPADIELMTSRNIKLINLADCGLLKNRNEALEFVFEYLSDTQGEDKPKYYYVPKWKTDSPAEIIGVLRNMREQRMEGWLLGKNLYRQFEEDDCNFIYLERFISEWTLQQKIDLVYEVDWRLGMAFFPKEIKLYKDILESAEKARVEAGLRLGAGTEQKLRVIKVSLLEILFENGNFDDFDDLVCKIKAEEQFEYWTDEILDRFYYLRCLKALLLGHREEANECVAGWNVSIRNYRGILWKTAILYELGEKNVAAQLLFDALNSLQQTSLAVSGNSRSMQSIKVMLEKQSALVRGEWMKSRDNDEVREIYQYFLKEYNDVMQGNGKSLRQVTQEHGFRINDITTHYSMGRSGYVPDLLWAYRIEKLGRYAGIPVSAVPVSVKQAFGTLSKYRFYYALWMSVATGNQDLVGSVLTRGNLNPLSHEVVVEIIDELFVYYGNLDDANKSKNMALFAICLMSGKGNEQQRRACFEKLVESYSERQRIVKGDWLLTLYESMSEEELASVVARLFESPNQMDWFRRMIPWPKLSTVMLRKVTITEDMVRKIEATLISEENEYQRMVQIAACAMSCDISDEYKRRLARAVSQSRKDDTQKKLVSFRYYPYDKDLDGGSCMKHIVEQVEQQLWDADLAVRDSSEPISRFKKMLEDVLSVADYLDDGAIESILHSIIQFYNTNQAGIETFLKRHDSEIEFFDLHPEVGASFWTLQCMINQKEANGFDWAPHFPLLNELYEITRRYAHLKVDTLPLEVELDRLLKKREGLQLRERAFEEVYTKCNHQRSAAAGAILLMAANKVNIQEKLTGVVGRARNESYYTHLLCDLVERRCVTKGSYGKLALVLNDVFRMTYDDVVDIMQKIDSMYAANRLAGCCSQIESMMKNSVLREAVEKWRIFSEDKNQFADIRRGFEHGVSMMRN